MAGTSKLTLLPLAAALAWCVPEACAQSAAATPAAEPDTAVPTSVFARNPASPVDAAQPPAPGADLHGDSARISDQELASAVASGLPRYSPPPAASSKTDDGKDLREIDKPQNQIVRLPSYVVREKAPPIFNEKQMLTRQGLGDYKIKTAIGVDPASMAGPFAANLTRFLFQDYANQEFTDSVRKQNAASASGTAAGLQQTGDTGESEFLKKTSDDTFMRRIEDASTPLDSHAGWGAPVPSNSNSSPLPGQ